MNKKTIIILIIIATIVFFAGFLAGKIPVGGKAPAPDAPDITEDTPVEVVANTTQEMLSADHWISEESDRVMFTSDEISAYNTNNPLFVLYYNSVLAKEIKLFMEELPEELTGEMVSSLLDPDYLNKKRSGNTYVNGTVPDDPYWENIKENCGYEDVPNSITPIYAFSLGRTVAMALPTEDFASTDPEEVFCNDLVSAEIMPFTGAVIIHESRDGKWYYVIYGSICGWVRKEWLAVCRDREEWLQICHPDEYLTVTGREIILDESPVETVSSRMILPMATKIKLTSDPPAQVNGRSTLGCYVVDIPKKGADGYLEWEQALIPKEEDVCSGPLDMTSSNVIRQAYKFLGHVYGWGGSLSSNDCSGLVRQVYGCFGFDLPRNAAAIAQLADLGSFDCSDMSTDKKLEMLAQLPGGTLLFMSGHIMIYLGMEDGRPYVISSCATYVDPDDGTGTLNNAYCVFVSGLDLIRSNGKTWLESLKYMQWRQY